MIPKATISDAGPLHYLILIEAVQILPALFGSIILPEAVHLELLHPSAPEAVRARMKTLPPWIELRNSAGAQLIPRLHSGETAVLSLAATLQPCRILMDDRAARRVAQQRNLEVIGTIGLLEVAAERRLVNLQDAFNRLRSTNFHIAQSAMDLALKRIQHDA
jgi:predicted nucleic acid-binding protein